MNCTIRFTFFVVQALWTTKRFEVPLIIVIFNNRGYQAKYQDENKTLQTQPSNSNSYVEARGLMVQYAG